MGKCHFASVGEMLRAEQPHEPVYCIRPQACREAARRFLNGFPGRVLYAVKANNEPAIIRLLHASGIRHFDCASLPEIAMVKAHCPDSICYFMIPVRLRGAAREAQNRYGVRHFMIDHVDGLELLGDEIDMRRSVVFARMAVHHESAIEDLSARFGAPPADIPSLLQDIRARGAEPALAFNVGSAVTDPEAYRHAMSVAVKTLETLPFKMRLIDIGGGFARSYPGFSVPPLEDYFQAVREMLPALPLATGGEILGEPGRALVAESLSAVVEVRLRKDDRLYINDGMYGIFWELRFKGHDRYPVQAFRNGEPLVGECRSFRLFGPTCDAGDVLPGAVDLPNGIKAGDYLEFRRIGAYSLSGRTSFNGYFSDRIVTVGSVSGR